MQRKRQKKSKVIIVLILLIACNISILAAKDDYRFIVTDMANRAFQKKEISEIKASKIKTKSYSILDLQKNDNVTFDQSMMLINKEHTLSEDIKADIVSYKDTPVKMNKCVVPNFSILSQKIIDKFGETLFISSSYRTKSEQESIINTNSSTATDVGASEHQIGLALDVYVKYYSGRGFLKSDVGQYVNSKCWEDGFIIRYPLGKKDITGIGFEPWHIRYVGLPHSEVIYKNSLTLEEYIDKLGVGKFYAVDDYIISRQNESGKISLPENFSECTISPDNMGNYIIAIKV